MECEFHSVQQELIRLAVHRFLQHNACPVTGCVF